jgi:tetratricopeptide (TPR) repeat protein
MRKIYIFYLLFFRVWIGGSFAAEDPFFTANEAFVAEKYGEAIAAFAQLPGHSFAQYFNLGCAYLKNEQPAQAWVAFEKARQIAPHHRALPPAFQQLALTAQQKNFIHIFQTKFYINIFTILAVIFFWLTLVFWIRRRMKGDPRRKPIYICKLLCLLFLGLLFYADGVRKKCITIKNDAFLRISPTIQAGVAEKIPEGTPLTIREKHSNFFNVSLGKGKTGWIQRGDVQPIVE